jgi:hypothetical protein
MVRAHIRTSLLVVSLSAVVSSGCTRIDSRLSEQRRNDPKQSPPVTLQATALSWPDHDEADLPLSIPKPTIEGPFVPDLASPNYAEAESVLDELDSALLRLEDLLGSTEHWDVAQP